MRGRIGFGGLDLVILPVTRGGQLRRLIRSVALDGNAYLGLQSYPRKGLGLSQAGQTRLMEVSGLTDRREPGLEWSRIGKLGNQMLNPHKL